MKTSCKNSEKNQSANGADGDSQEDQTHIIFFQKEAEGVTIYTEVKDLHKISASLEAKGLKIMSAEIEYVPKEKVELADGDKEKFEKILEALEDNEDVSDYYTNLAD